jgi:hypothetical protein
VRTCGRRAAADTQEATVAVSERISLRELYLYLVCLVTLVISLFAAVNLVRSGVELAYPDPGAYGWHEPGADLDEAERARQEQLARDSQRRYAVLGLVSAGTTLLVAAPAYVYHWRRVQEERARQRTAVPAA